MFNRLLGLLLLVGSSAFAQCEGRKSLVSVTGVGEVTAQPDEVTFKVTVQNFDRDSNKARNDNKVRLDAVLSTLKQYAIERKDIVVDDLSLDTRYKSDDETRSAIGILASSRIRVTLKQVEKLAPLRNELLSAGATTVGNVDFKSSRLIQLRGEARTLALRAAREKADAMAKALGQSIGRAYAISESVPRRYATSNAMSVNPVEAGADQSVAGMISIREQVSVEFELQ
jgi:uncharacterized protein